MSKKYTVGQTVEILSGYAPTFMDAIELHQSTGEGGHQFKVGSVGTIVEIDEHDDFQPYGVLGEVNGEVMTQWVMESQIALKGGK